MRYFEYCACCRLRRLISASVRLPADLLRHMMSPVAVCCFFFIICHPIFLRACHLRYLAFFWPFLVFLSPDALPLTKFPLQHLPTMAREGNFEYTAVPRQMGASSGGRSSGRNSGKRARGGASDEEVRGFLLADYLGLNPSARLPPKARGPVLRSTLPPPLTALKARGI